MQRMPGETDYYMLTKVDATVIMVMQEGCEAKLKEYKRDLRKSKDAEDVLFLKVEINKLQEFLAYCEYYIGKAFPGGYTFRV